jgi:hypothetical protein
VWSRADSHRRNLFYIYCWTAAGKAELFCFCSGRVFKGRWRAWKLMCKSGGTLTSVPLMVKWKMLGRIKTSVPLMMKWKMLGRIKTSVPLMVKWKMLERIKTSVPLMVKWKMLGRIKTSVPLMVKWKMLGRIKTSVRITGPSLWSSGQSSWLQIQRSGFDSRRYQIFWEAVCLERSPLNLVSTIEELLGRKSKGSGLGNRDYGRRDSSLWPCGTFYPQKLSLTVARLV